MHHVALLADLPEAPLNTKVSLSKSWIGARSTIKD